MSRRAKLIIWPLVTMLIAAGLYRWIPQLETGRLADQLHERGGRFDQNEAGEILWLRLPPETGDEDLLVLRNCELLRHLDLSGTRVTDAGLRNLGVLPRLVRLNLSETANVRHGLQVASNWPALEEFSAVGNQWVTDDQVQNLKSCAKLQSVDLSGTPVTDAGVEALCTLPDLQWWTLRDCELITDAGLALLSAQEDLQGVNLARTSVTWTAWRIARDQGPVVFDESNPLLFAEFSLLRDGGAEYSEQFGNEHARLSVDQDLPAEAFDSLALLPPLESLTIHSSTLTDDHLIPCLEQSPNLLYLSVARSTVTGRTLAAAARHCPQLVRIDVSHTHVAAADMSYIAAFVSLSSLSLQGLDLAGADLSEWEHLTSVLFIRLEDSTLDDAALETLPLLPKLEILSISRTRITADGLASLAPQPSLKYLDIENIPLSESGLQALASVPLEYLSIGPGLKREFIELLSEMNIRSMNVRDPQFTESEVAALSEMANSPSITLCGRLGPDTLRSMAGLRDLRTLGLREAEYDAAALEEFRQIRPDVTIYEERPTVPSAQ